MRMWGVRDFPQWNWHSHVDYVKVLDWTNHHSDQDNDFYYIAFDESKDFRRYWKDFNLHLFYQKEFSKFWGSFNFIYSRSLNYQWELTQDMNLPYYQPGRDVNNLHLDFKITIPIGL